MRFMSHNHAEPVIAKYRSKPASDGTTFYGSKGWVQPEPAGLP